MVPYLFVLFLLSMAAYVMARYLGAESRLAAANAIARWRGALGLQTMADLQRAAANLVCGRAPVTIDARHLPNDVLVLLNPRDLKAIGALTEEFCAGVATLLHAAVRNGGRDGDLPFRMLGDPRVRLKSDPRVARGTVGVVAAVAELTRMPTPHLNRGVLLELNLGGERTALEGELTVGRGVDADIRLAAPEVSREHARLRCRGMEVWIFDLQGGNGTSVNGEEVVEQRRLRVGDRIRFGGGPTAVVELSSRARYLAYRNTEPMFEHADES